jgi:hypothetical protein
VDNYLGSNSEYNCFLFEGVGREIWRVIDTEYYYVHCKGVGSNMERK